MEYRERPQIKDEQDEVYSIFFIYDNNFEKAFDDFQFEFKNQQNA